MLFKLLKFINCHSEGFSLKNQFGLQCRSFILLIIMLALSSASFAQEIPKIRELPSNPTPINNQILKNDKNNIYKTQAITKKLEKNLTVTETNKTTQLKGGVSELKAIVGKSQLIRFDEPIKRISITDPNLADLVIISPKEMLVNGKAGGETSLIIWGETGNPIMFNLFVQNDSINFVKEIKKIAPDDDIKIDFINSGSQTGMKVAISGRISSTITRDKIKNLVTAYGYTLIDNTEALTPQIMLSLKIVEINRTKVKNKTSNYLKGPLSNDYMTKTFGVDVSAIDPLTSTRVNGNDAVSIIQNLLNMTGGSIKNTQTTFPDGNGFTFWRWNITGNDQTAQVFKVAETEGIISILAEPKLMAINGQAATFNAGEQIPVVKGRDEYGGLIIEYKDSGINVSFTPTILEQSGRILLKIAPEINQPSASAISTVDGFPIYGFTTRKTDTTVELEDNQTMVIGGLIQKKSNLQKTKIPYLSNLPIIGNLLNNSTYNKDETELMIFVTPTIIKPDDVVNGV
ncbi:MAG: pilus assembly protein N-terminal domain-containing protein [bacterium]